MKFVGCPTSFSYWLKPPTSHLSQSHSLREVEKASLMDAQRRLKECIKKTQAVGSLACFLWRCSGHLQPQGMTKTGCKGIQLKLEMRTAPKNHHAPDGHLENEVDNGMAEPSVPLGPNDNLVHPPWSKPKRYPWRTPSRWWFCQKGSIFINFLFMFIHVYSSYRLCCAILVCQPFAGHHQRFGSKIGGTSSWYPAENASQLDIGGEGMLGTGHLEHECRNGRACMIIYLLLGSHRDRDHDT